MCWHFEAGEDIITKIKSQGLYIIKMNIEMLVGWLASLPHSRPPECRHFTAETGKTAYTFATQCIQILTSTYIL